GAYEDYGSGVADYRLARRGEDYFFEYLNLKTDSGVQIGAKGTVSTGGEELRLDMAADWERLRWPLTGGAPVVVSRSGEGTIRGTLADYEIDVDAHLAGPNIPPGRWALAGKGTQEKMAIRSLRGDVLAGRLTATGNIAWKPQVTWNVKLNGDGLNPGAQWPEWPGRVAFAATSDGVLRDAGPFGRVNLLELDGNLRGNPLAGRVYLELAGERYRLPRLDLRSGSARLTASGAFTQDRGDIDWRLAAPNLGEALPDSGGSVTAQGNLTGPWKSPRVRAQADGQGIVFRTYNAETLALVADVDLASNGPMLIDLDATSVGVGERRFETVALDAQGTRRDHEIALAVRAEEGNLDLALAGGLEGTTTWDGLIRQLDLQNEQTGTWQLAQPAALTAGTERASLQDFCWVSPGNDGARLCAEGQWVQGGPWNTSGTVEDMPFSLLEPFLPPDLEITGDIQGRFSGQGSPAGMVTAEVDLRPGPGEIRYPTESGETAQVRYDEGLVTLTAGADGLTGRAAFTFPDTGTLEADLRLPQYNQIGAPLQQQTLDGRIAANLRNLGLVEAFVPDLNDVRGTLAANFDLAGTVAQPRVVGAAELRQAQADVPEYGLELRQIELTARSDGQGPIDVSGSARSGRGNLSISGAIAMDGQPARFEIDGRNFLASDTRQARVIVSPDLQVTVADGRIEVTGDVTVPEAEIAQQDRKAAIPVSDDVVIISGEEVVEAEDSAWDVYARVRVILGEEVEVKASGFTGEIDGSLLLIEQPDRPTTAVGELVIEEGRYKAYGQDLTIERGRIIYAGGPLDNPGVDLRAFRKAADGTVAGINVRGTLRSPQTTLYSDPPMGQSEALAYLLLGRPLGQASTEDADLLARAADSLGLRGGNLLAKKLGARFGLEEARVETTGGLDEASLVLGKYLSPRLYVNYGIGLFEPISIFRIRYILGREWTLQAEQGEGTSADILYTVERGKGGETPVPRRDPAEPVRVPAGEGGGGGR
ncbi:MAG TPA: translocation/assembly module TamB domain-containing protein, partial [Thermoanaerobaculia bacterium]|nr:translocation/assembly module TamB domain-containing protein [Thermoanaerobaculia bacterium]